MIDRDLVTRKMVLISRDLNAVAPFAQKPLDTYLASVTDEVLVERWLERAIGRMIDINYHLITEAGDPPPRDYYESFVQLARLGVLPVTFASRIAACAGLRNRIVHEYDEIDPERVPCGAADRSAGDSRVPALRAAVPGTTAPRLSRRIVTGRS